jgi:hypothetical protein
MSEPFERLSPQPAWLANTLSTQQSYAARCCADQQPDFNGESKVKQLHFEAVK